MKNTISASEIKSREPLGSEFGEGVVVEEDKYGGEILKVDGEPIMAAYNGYAFPVRSDGKGDVEILPDAPEIAGLEGKTLEAVQQFLGERAHNVDTESLSEPAEWDRVQAEEYVGINEDSVTIGKDYNGPHLSADAVLGKNIGAVASVDLNIDNFFNISTIQDLLVESIAAQHGLCGSDPYSAATLDRLKSMKENILDVSDFNSAFDVAFPFSSFNVDFACESLSLEPDELEKLFEDDLLQRSDGLLGSKAHPEWGSLEDIETDTVFVYSRPRGNVLSLEELEPTYALLNAEKELGIIEALKLVIVEDLLDVNNASYAAVYNAKTGQELSTDRPQWLAREEGLMLTPQQKKMLDDVSRKHEKTEKQQDLTR